MKETKSVEVIDVKVAGKFILRTDHIIEVQRVPLYDIEAFAGIHDVTINEYVPTEVVEFEAMPSCDGAMHVRGNSMYPVLFNGDIVLFKTTQSRRAGLCFGEIYIVSFVEDGVTYSVVKYLKESTKPGYYTLASANPDYADKDILRDSVKVLALVKGSCRTYSE